MLIPQRVGTLIPTDGRTVNLSLLHWPGNIRLKNQILLIRIQLKALRQFSALPLHHNLPKIAKVLDSFEFLEYLTSD